MSAKFLEKRNVTPDQAMRILRKNGIEVSEKDARKILDFMYIIANLAIRDYGKQKNLCTVSEGDTLSYENTS